MKHQLLKFLVLFFLGISLLSYASCGDDKDEDTDCGKDIYDPMENNPAKKVDWLVEMVNKNHENVGGYISLYKLGNDDYYLSDIIKSGTPNFCDNNLTYPCFFTYIYTADGTFYAVNTGENYETFKNFLEKAVLVKKIWSYTPCEFLYY